MMYEIVHKTAEQAVLVGVVLAGQPQAEEEESLAELALLAEAAGPAVKAKVIQHRRAVDPAFYIGEGKAWEIKELVDRQGLNVIIFDDDLTPAQIKNLEAVLNHRVADRSTIILDIFYRRARTRQAQLQVEIARLQYLLPRLTKAWQHLEQQDGGYGLRGGPGEKQLELDRRMARKRIKDLNRELEKVRTQTQVESQLRQGSFRVALVGYTNSGKSTLFNRITGHPHVIERDQLFTTLDTTVRKIASRKGRDIVISDTVGFISKLPVHLLDAFHTTLQEAIDADLILHVIDITAARVAERIETVNRVLAHLGAHSQAVVRVFNKTDKVASPGYLKQTERAYPNAVLVSALQGEGIDRVRQLIESNLDAERKEVKLFCPYRIGKYLARVYDTCEVLNRQDDDQGTVLTIRATEEHIARLRRYGFQGVPVPT